MLGKAWGGYENGGWLSVHSDKKKIKTLFLLRREFPLIVLGQALLVWLSQVTRHCSVELSARNASGSDGRGTL